MENNANKEIITIRAELGLSRAELAELMGMRYRDLWRLETGRRQPTRIQQHFLQMIRRCHSVTEKP